MCNYFTLALMRVLVLIQRELAETLKRAPSAKKLANARFPNQMCRGVIKITTKKSNQSYSFFLVTPTGLEPMIPP